MSEPEDVIEETEESVGKYVKAGDEYIAAAASAYWTFYKELIKAGFAPHEAAGITMQKDILK